MATAHTDDVGVEPRAEEREIAEDIEDLVASELVWEAQIVVNHSPVGSYDEGVCVGSAFPDSLSSEGFGLRFGEKCSCRSNLACEAGIFEDEGEVLAGQAFRFVVEVIGDDKVVVGLRHGNKACVSLRDEERFVDGEYGSLGVLLDDAGVGQESSKRFGAAVNAGELLRVKLNEEIVNLQSEGGREQVFDCLYGGLPTLQTCSSRTTVDTLGTGTDRGVSGEVPSDEEDSLVRVCGLADHLNGDGAE